ncbi:hypothetical protein D3C81_1595620 [compost metagenome]
MPATPPLATLGSTSMELRAMPFSWKFGVVGLSRSAASVSASPSACQATARMVSGKLSPAARGTPAKLKAAQPATLAVLQVLSTGVEICSP